MCGSLPSEGFRRDRRFRRNILRLRRRCRPGLARAAARLERVVCSDCRCSPPAFGKLRRLFSVESNARGTQPPPACYQKFPVAAAVAKSVLDNEAVVVERLRRDTKEGRRRELCGSERVAADVGQSGMVLCE